MFESASGAVIGDGLAVGKGEPVVQNLHAGISGEL
jgi:hypothetical protein